MYDIYGNIYHQYTPNVSIYIPYMDPMDMIIGSIRSMTSWDHKSFRQSLTPLGCQNNSEKGWLEHIKLSPLIED